MSDFDKPAVIEMWRTCRLLGGQFFTSGVRMEARKNGKEYYQLGTDSFDLPGYGHWVLVDNRLFFEKEVGGSRTEIGLADHVHRLRGSILGVKEPNFTLVEFWSKKQDLAFAVRDSLNVAFEFGFSEGEESMKRRVLSNLFDKK